MRHKTAPFLVFIVVVVTVCLVILNKIDTEPSEHASTEEKAETTKATMKDSTKASTSTKQDKPVPPEKGAVYNDANGHWYKVYNYKDYGLAEDFNAWEQFCASKNGYMAVINDAEENQFIYNFLLNKGLTVAFFGYTDEFSEGQWTWIHGNSTYTNWAPGQPNNGANNESGRTEDYAQFYKETANGMWNDAPIAENSYRFVCEWDN